MSNLCYLLMVLACLALADAAQALGLRDIKVLEALYSEVTLSATVDYAGELGDAVMFGATAVTDESVRGVGFRPMTLTKGSSEIHFSVSRPESGSLEALTSRQLQVMVYNRETSSEERINYVIDWPGFTEHFGLDAAATASKSASIRSATINERFDNGNGLVQALVKFGIEPNEIELFALDLSSGAKGRAALVVPDTASPDDLAALLGLLRDKKIVVEKIQFVGIDEKAFKHGHVKIVRPGIVAVPTLPRVLLDKVKTGTSLNEVYGFYGVQPRAAADLGRDLLDKAIALNDIGTRSAGAEAQTILNSLVEMDYRNPRVYEQLARAYSRGGDLEDTVEQQRTAINMSLKLFPNNHWAHAYLVFLETELGNHEEAFKQLALAQKHGGEQNLWLTVYGGRLHRAVGDYAKAAEMLKPLLNLKNLNATDDRARYYGLVAYAEVLQELPAGDVAGAYRAIIAAYPERGACNKLDFARYLLMRELDSLQSSQLLAQTDARACRGVKQLQSLAALLEWHAGSGSQQSLFRIALEYGDMTELVLQAAQFKNGEQLLRAMAAKGVALDTANRHGYSALHLVAQQAKVVAVTNLLSAGMAVDSRAAGGLTPLMLAVSASHAGLVRLLLDAGADRKISSEYGFTALDLAHSFGNEEIIALLTDASTI